MRAVRIHRFGGPEAIVCEEVSRPSLSEGQVLVRVKAAGVGPWDAWVRTGKSALPQPLPLTKTQVSPRLCRGDSQRFDRVKQ